MCIGRECGGGHMGKELGGGGGALPTHPSQCPPSPGWGCGAVVAVRPASRAGHWEESATSKCDRRGGKEKGGGGLLISPPPPFSRKKRCFISCGAVVALPGRVGGIFFFFLGGDDDDNTRRVALYVHLSNGKGCARRAKR